ncbi:MAG TPA: hypothetical protein VEL76_20735 [Gemmataceae bacterium]|nr:hypothetical protein [Gemmataceae bacterium]
MHTLPEDLDQRLRAELRECAHVVWVGQPRPSRLAWSGLPVALFGILITALVVFWVASAAGILFGPVEGGGQGGFVGLCSCLALFGSDRDVRAFVDGGHCRSQLIIGDLLLDRLDALVLAPNARRASVCGPAPTKGVPLTLW